jgi:pimeloyl-ACP methyl ester carboxylesterase
MLAMRVSIAHPTHVAAMALLDTSADAEGFPASLKYRLLVGIARRYGLPESLIRREVAPLMFGPKTLRERPELVDQAARRVNGYPREGVARASMAVVIERRSVLARLGGLQVPTLVMCGRDDRALTPDHSEAIASTVKGARLVWIEDSGHMSAIEQPEAVNATLVPFVREQLRA